MSLAKFHSPSNLDYFFSRLYPVSNYKLFFEEFDLFKHLVIPADYMTDNVKV